MSGIEQELCAWARLSLARSDRRCGLYLQDQIELPYHFFLLVGFRYDNAEENSTSQFGGGKSSDEQISPRGGALRRPIPWLSLYSSYVDNFGAGNSSLFDRKGKPLPPETAQQWELGVKTEFFDGRLGDSLSVKQYIPLQESYAT